MIEFTELSDSDHQHFAKELFEDSFPAEERPTFSHLKERTAPNFHFVVATIDEDEPVGILTYWLFDEFAYVEHFAIAPDFRNQGFGKAVMLNFMMKYPDQVVLEIELPTTEQADHRLEFYTDLGFTRNPQPYWQPSYHRRDQLALPMIIMSRYELDDGEFEEVKEILYRNVYKYEQKS
ncbi:MAG: GNAT family N-acetyltransferase [Bacteroidales bacterium]|nr:GNAT family N-acetyltransferase [Bacteroidales bacterium]